MKELKHIIAGLLIVAGFLQVNAITPTMTMTKADSCSVEQKIKRAFDVAMTTGNNEQLLQMVQELDGLETHIQAYWRTFALYENSLFYLNQKNEKMAMKILSEGIDLLKDVESKGVEDYALLSMMQGVSCHFMGFPRVIGAARSSSANLSKAKAIDADNVRVLYVQAYVDFHRPETFGGMKKTEGCLLKALSLPATVPAGKNSPTWGREECFELMARYYLKKGQRDEALKYINRGLAEYPDNRMLKSLCQ